MYEFIDINQHQPSASLPSVAMSFNGIIIEDAILGYQTLTVSGREMIGVQLDTQSIRNGSLTLDRRLPSREIVVQYRLEAEDNYQFQKKFQLLRSLLHTTDKVEVFFVDEPDVFYQMELSGVDSVSNSSNTIVSSFTLHSDTPFKFGKPVVTNGDVTINTPYPTPAHEIRLLLSASTQLVTITNGTQEIRLDGNFATGEELVINTQQGTVMIGANDVTYTVALNSDFENFTVEQGQTVTSPQGAIELRMRERWL